MPFRLSLTCTGNEAPSRVLLFKYSFLKDFERNSSNASVVIAVISTLASPIVSERRARESLQANKHICLVETVIDIAGSDSACSPTDATICIFIDSIVAIVL